MNKIIVVFGTRPELIKLFPVIKEFEIRNMRNRLILIDSGQHAEFTNEILKDFNIVSDYHLHSLDKGQSLQSLTIKLLTEFQEIIIQLKTKGENISAILTQGDTNTTLASALSGFYNKIPVLHLEAGLRTNDLMNPYPEEFNRKTVDLIASYHYAPTLSAKNNLIKEGIDESTILTTGNTIVDALKTAIHQHNIGTLIESFSKYKHVILITSHRRENQEGKRLLFENIKQMAEICADCFFLWINHPNNTLTINEKCMTSNFEIIPPVNYSSMLYLYKHIKLIITDSGGIQEEAASFSIPTLIIRTKTEREELIDSGIGRIIDFSFESLHKNFHEFIELNISLNESPFGEGKAAKQIVDHITEIYFS